MEREQLLGSVFEFHAYRPPSEGEQVDSIHVLKPDGKPIIPVQIYGVRPNASLPAPVEKPTNL